MSMTENALSDVIHPKIYKIYVVNIQSIWDSTRRLPQLGIELTLHMLLRNLMHWSAIQLLDLVGNHCSLVTACILGDLVSAF